MKIFIWLLTIALAVVCLTCWMSSTWILRPLSREALPVFTLFVFYSKSWILFCPLPWVIYAVILSRRKELNVNATFIFAGTIILAATILFCALFTTCIYFYFENIGTVQALK